MVPDVPRRRRQATRSRNAPRRARNWDALAEPTRRRYQRAGVTRAGYESGQSLTAARGHKRTPEHPGRAGADPDRYHGYLVGKGRLSIRMDSTEGTVYVTRVNAPNRSLIGKHSNAVRAYLAGLDPGGKQLATFRGRRIAGYELETRGDALQLRSFQDRSDNENFYEGALV